MRSIDLVVIHCSASPNGESLARADGTTPIQVIDGWHKARGFRRSKLASAAVNPTLGSIGYHVVIYTNGAIASGRSLDEIGAHARGHNARSIGLCLIGTDKFTAAQWSALAGAIASLTKMYPAARVVGHRDLSPDLDGDGTVEPREWLKTCPGFDVATWLAGGMTPPVGHLLPGGA